MTNNIQESDVWVAVLHYSSAENTIACIRSIQQLNFAPLHILILDNCSPDQSGKLVSMKFPTCSYHRTEDNLGFAGGSNAAVNYCISKGAKWIWLLNNDTELDTESLQMLISAAQINPRAGILGAAIYTPSKEGYHRSGTGKIDYRRAKTLERGNIDESQQSIACEWISGCNMLFRAEAFAEMGGFDERYFLYFEDTDLCWRMNQANWQTLFVPNSKIKHIGGASTEGKLAIWRSYYYTRNRLLFFLSAKKGFPSIPIILAICAHLLRHTIVLPFRGEKGRRQLKAELLGLSDYLSGKFGKATRLDF